jgi:hypothetical protein
MFAAVLKLSPRSHIAPSQPKAFYHEQTPQIYTQGLFLADTTSGPAGSLVFRIHGSKPLVSPTCAELHGTSSVAVHPHSPADETNQYEGQLANVGEALQDPGHPDPGVPQEHDDGSVEHTPATAVEDHPDQSSVQEPDVKGPELGHDDEVQHGPSIGAKVAEVEQPVQKTRLELALLDSGATCEQPSVYVVRRDQTHITPENIAEKLDVGVVSGCDTLQNISLLLEHVYIPLLLSELPQQDTLDGAGGVASSSTEQSTEAELLAAMQKFLAQVKISSSHLTGNMQLTIPNVDVHSMDEKDDELLQTLESSLHTWTLTLQKLKQAQAGKTAEIEGPLGEIYFWGERNNVLGSLYEQINQPRVQRMMQYGSHNIFQPMNCLC